MNEGDDRVDHDAHRVQWARVLDRYEARLDEQRLALTQVAHGTGDLAARGVPPTFVPPPDLGRMPAELAPRAAALAAETREVATLAEATLAALPAPGLQRTPLAPASRAVFDRAL